MSASEVAALPVVVREVEEDEWEVVEEVESVPEVPESIRDAFTEELVFYVNGVRYAPEPASIDPTMKLVEFLQQVGLTGTKLGCGEGGCGACTVVLSRPDAATGTATHLAVNSCLRPVYTLDGAMITTTEGLGSERRGLHPIQKRIAEYNGSQCGFCTPGHVMSMYGLLSNEPSPTPQQVEDRFDGNLCRCTGYRPILRAMQTFASDGSEPRVRVSDGADDDDAAPCGHAMLVGPRECAPGTCCDVEDICADDAAVPPELPAELLERAKSPRPLMVRSRSSGRLWFRPTSLSSVYDLLKTYASSSVVRLCVGNTSIGVAKYYVPNKADDPSVFIDIGQLSDLTGATVTSSSLVVGAAVTLTQLHDELVSHASSGGVYFDALAKHLMHVANWDVRNVGSWAGNLMLHKQHKNFPSDLVTILTAAGALVVVSSSAGSRTLSVPDLMAATLEPDELLFSLAIPFAAATSAKVDPGAAGAKKTFFETFKVSDRAQNAHALVNAGFNVVVSLDGDATPTVDEAYLCFGGVRTGLLVASDAANALKGQPVSSATLSSVLSVLEKECEPPADPSPRTWVLTPAAYRQSLACTLFYKFFLSMMADLEPSSVPSSLKSAYAPAVRPVSSGTDFITMTKWDDYPVHAPFPKLSAPAQASGEAQYVGDMMPAGNVLEAAFVQSTAPKATITSLDVSQALKAPGVVDVITAADIAKIGGSNNCGQFPGDEEILASSKVIYVGQPLAVVVADTYEHAHAASKLVAVTYEADKDHPPVFTIKEAVTADSYLTNNQYVSNPMPTLKRGDVTTGFKDSAKVVSGAVSLGMQYHMYMETQRAMVVPEEMNGLRVYAATQAPSMTRDYVSQATGLPDNQIQVEVKRVGGAYGGKISRSQVISSAAAVAARYLNKPVRLVLDRQHDMNFQGRRNGFEADYKIGFDEDGKVQAVQSAFLMNGGATYDSTLGSCYTVQLMLDNAYFYPNVQTSIAAVRTSLCSNTSMRAPGMLQGTTFAEVIMDRIAWELQMEPNDVREANMYKDGETTPFGQKITTFDARMPVVWKTLLEMADYDTRRAAVDAFNKANRWVKRGIRCMPLKYMIVNDKYQYRNTAIVALHTDGTVIVTTSGCEAGQGLNTKVAQTVAFELGVPLSAVNVAKTSTEKITLSTPTGGSGTSETCCEAAILACKTLNDTLAPYKKAHPDFSFGQLVSAAFYDGQAIEAIGNCALPTNPDGVVEYWVYAGACSEVSVDVLTGKVELLRTDIVYDGGESLNAMVDIGQVEGAFVQGLGFCFSEEVVLDGSTGRMINNGTWDYKPPSSKDIPINFNVRMLGLASDAPNSILSSKASGEPPYQLAVSALLAAKEAIYAARKDAGNTDYFDFDTPATVDKIQAACLVSVDQLTL